MVQSFDKSGRTSQPFSRMNKKRTSLNHCLQTIEENPLTLGRGEETCQLSASNPRVLHTTAFNDTITQHNKMAGRKAGSSAEKREESLKAVTIGQPNVNIIGTFFL